MNSHLYSLIVASSNMEALPETESRTDLDSHANMGVVGSEAYILADLGKIRDVYPYTPDYRPMQVQIVDAAARYESPFDGKVYILVIRNALYVPSMKYNLVPLFVMREAGVIVRDTPKIHTEEPTEEDHALTFPETGFRILLSLTGTFSFFPTTKSSDNDLIDPEEVYILIPATWNPHLDVYARNEESMLDWEGNLKPKKERENKIVFDDTPEDDVEMASLVVSSAESAQIDAAMADEMSIQYDNLSLDDALFQRAWEGDFKMSIGSTMLLTRNIYSQPLSPVVRHLRRLIALK
jgi:hypothetical protein